MRPGLLKRILGSARVPALLASVLLASCTVVPEKPQASRDSTPSLVPLLTGPSPAFDYGAGSWVIAASGWDACNQPTRFSRKASALSPGLSRMELAANDQPGAALQEWFGLAGEPYQHGISLRRLPACHTGSQLVVTLQSSLPLRPASGATTHFEALAPDGGVVAHYRGLQVFDADARPVAFQVEQRSAYELALSLDLSRAAFPLTIDPWIEGPGASHTFFDARNAVSLSSDALWLAEAGEGTVQLSQQAADGFSVQQRLRPPGPVQPLFGAALTFAGPWLVVAAPDQRNPARAADVLVYGRDGNERWGLTQTLEAADRNAEAGFGTVLAGDAQWLVVGTPVREWESGATLDVFSVDASGVRPVSRLLGPSPDLPDGFASAASVSGGELFVGAPLTHADAVHAGRVHHYRLGAEGVEYVGSIDAPRPRLRGLFGRLVASNARWLVIASSAGELDVYARESGRIAHVGRLQADGEPGSLLLTGDRLLINAGSGTGPLQAIDLATLQPLGDAGELAGRSPQGIGKPTSRWIDLLDANAKNGSPAAPTLTLDEPAENAVLNTRQPEIHARYTSSTAIDIGSVQWTVNDVPVTFECDRQSPGTPKEGPLRCQATADLPFGAQVWRLSIADRRGARSEPVVRSVAIGAVEPPPALPESAVTLLPLPDGWRIEVATASLQQGAVLVGKVQGLAEPEVGAGAGGVAVLELAAQPGDTLLVGQRNVVGMLSPWLALTPGLPTPPADVAPPLDGGGAATSGHGAGFLIEGENPIQQDADPQAFDAVRTGVVRGRLLDRDQGPLAGVRVSVVGHADYGYTLSRDDGAFDLLVNGGGEVLLEFRKSGYLFAQRKVYVPWNDFVVLDDVALVALDPAVTRVLAGSATPQLVVGSVSEDDTGPRQPAIYFPPGVQASMVLPDGTTAPLAELDVRMTEYTVGERGLQAMPSPLPPTTAYTYAIELSVDQALEHGAKVDGRDVVFDRPVSFYVDNFMGFPVGEGVPTGYYDNTAGEWKAVNDGRVLGMLDVVDGMAVLDVSGGGMPASQAELDQLQVSTEELRAIAQRFAPGESFWRVQLLHFSTWDCNWPFGPPWNAIKHFVEFFIDLLKSEHEEDECGCIIGTTTGDLAESVSAPGVPLGLHYNSTRTAAGSKPSIKLTLTPEEIPDSMKDVILIIEFLGKRFESRAMAVPLQRARVSIDFFDPYSRAREGSYPLTIKVGYVYEPVLRGAAAVAGGGSGGGGSGPSFGAAGRMEITGDRERMEIIEWWEHTEDVTFQSVETQRETAGWQLDAQHQLDVASGVLLMGDGRTAGMHQRPEIIRTIAGSDASGDGVEGAPALGRTLNGPRAIAVDARNRVYIADSGRHRVRRVEADGRMVTVAGGAAPGFVGDGGPASAALLHTPSALAFDAEGRLYIADTGNHRIRRVEADGTIVTVMGTGAPGLANEGVPASGAPVNAPRGVAANPFGYVFVADTGNDLVWSIQPDGNLVRLAGGGSGAGPQARDMALGTPAQLAADALGNVYVAERDTGLVRLLRPDGMMLTAAGGGTDRSANNVPAQDALLDPTGVAVDHAQRLLIADAAGNRLRRVDGNGTIVTLGGTGGSGYAADGIPARKVPVEAPQAIALDRLGRILFAHYHAVRRVAHERPTTAAGEIRVADPSGEMVHVFDAQGRHLRTLDALTGGLLYRFTYQDGAVTGLVDAFGNTTVVERDPTGQPTGLVSPYGQRTAFTLDPRGYLKTLVTPEGHTTEFRYTQDGLLEWMRNPRDHEWTYTYDPDGRLTDDDRPDGSGWDITWTEIGNGRESAFTSRLGRVTTYGVVNRPDGTEVRYTRAPDGAETYSEITPDGEVSTLHADGTSVVSTRQAHPRFGTQAMLPSRTVIETPSGLRSEVVRTYEATTAGDELLSWRETTTVNGNAYTLDFDKGTMRLTSRTPEGRTASMLVDEQRRPLKVEVLGLADVDYTYDERGRLESVRQTGGGEFREYRFGYDANGFLANVTDPLQRTFSVTYNRDGRAQLLLLPEQREIALDVDGNGNVTALRTPEGSLHRFGYDPLDREIRYEAPPRGLEPEVTSTVFDLDGNPERQSFPGDTALNFSYDAFGRLKSVSRPSQTGDYESEVRLEYEYDGFLTIAEKSTARASAEVRYGYDDQFRVKEFRGPGAITRFDYDADSLLTAAVTESTIAAAPATIQLTLERDKSTNLLLGSTTGIIDDSWSWNAFSEPRRYVARVEGETLFLQEFERDPLGRITKKTETVLGYTTVYEYRYDVSGHLDNVIKNGIADESYTYDSNGNRKTRTKGGTTITYIHDAQDRLLEDGDCTYEYTANGALQAQTCADGITTYSYNVSGDLTAVELPNGNLIEYVVDGHGRRVGKKVNGTLVEKLHYGPLRGPIAWTHLPSGATAHFVYADKPHVPAYMLLDGAFYRIISDHLGSTRLVVDAVTGEIVTQNSYTAWGELIEQKGQELPFGFAGGIFDSHTRLVRFGARDYSPRISRWLSKDAIGFDAAQASLYVYAGQDPINYVDTDGTFAWGAAFAALDLGMQLYSNGGDFSSVNWAQVGMSAVGGGLLSALGKGAFRLKSIGSHTWGATRSWMNRRGIQMLRPGQQRHHWLLERNQGLGRHFPDWAKNQPWNTNPISAEFNQWLAKNPQLAWLGAPSWAAELASGLSLWGFGGDNCNE